MKAIVFFSATGVTRRVSRMLSDMTGADLFEIIPKQLYTKEDLDWTNKTSRTSVENQDEYCRPEFEMFSADFSMYDEIFVGFPIWWYRAPKIIHTFFEKYDLSGKRVILFATSAGSGMGKTKEKLGVSCQNVEFIEGLVYLETLSDPEIEKALESLLKI